MSATFLIPRFDRARWKKERASVSASFFLHRALAGVRERDVSSSGFLRVMMWQSPLPVQVRPNASEVAPPGGRTPFLPGLWWSAQPGPQPIANALAPLPTVTERGTALESLGRAPTPRSGFFPGVWD